MEHSQGLNQHYPCQGATSGPGVASVAASRRMLLAQVVDVTDDSSDSDAAPAPAAEEKKPAKRVVARAGRGRGRWRSAGASLAFAWKTPVMFSLHKAAHLQVLCLPLRL